MKTVFYTEEAIDTRIADVKYTGLGLSGVVCQIVLDNGYSIFGEAQSDWGTEKAEAVAYQRAYGKLYDYFGFYDVENKYQTNHVEENKEVA